MSGTSYTTTVVMDEIVYINANKIPTRKIYSTALATNPFFVDPLLPSSDSLSLIGFDALL